MIHNPIIGGKKLPTLTNPAGAANIQTGYEAIDGNGDLITGTHEEPTAADFTSDATATAANIDSGKTAYVKGTKITGTSTKVDTSDATAAAGDIASGKTAYVNGSKVTGNASKAVHGTITTSSQTASITIPDLIGKNTFTLISTKVASYSDTINSLIKTDNEYLGYIQYGTIVSRSSDYATFDNTTGTITLNHSHKFYKSYYYYSSY